MHAFSFNVLHSQMWFTRSTLNISSIVPVYTGPSSVVALPVGGSVLIAARPSADIGLWKSVCLLLALGDFAYHRSPWRHQNGWRDPDESGSKLGIKQPFRRIASTSICRKCLDNHSQLYISNILDIHREGNKYKISWTFGETLIMYYGMLCYAAMILLSINDCMYA